ncbi:MAG TPA: aldo/keto reductase [Thermomicrobiales bacterium]|nr:aldo/keto reductase [Thermomicrobiales bacterium]
MTQHPAPPTLRWGILGTGAIARTFARGVAESRSGELVAVASRARATAAEFGERVGVARRYDDYAALLADDAVDAVYVATPHAHHAEWAVKAAEAGKHVLCEKPLALNHAEAMAVVEAARRHDVFLMEAFMYRCHPQTARLVELLRERVIGDVRLIEASYCFDSQINPGSRLYDNALGGGGILDVGGYPVSMARLLAGAALGRDVAEPLELTGCGHIGEVGRVDEWAIAALKFPGDIVAQLATGVRVQGENVVRVYGSAGHIVVPVPWLPGRDGRASSILVYRRGEPSREEVVVEPAAGLYAIEADTVADNLAARQAPPPAMTWADSLGNMAALDRWRAAVGLVYDAERPDADWPTVHRRPLARRPDATMRYGRIPGLEKPVSRLVMGADNQETLPHASVMFDDFFERGGNCFDTAYIYGQGRCERLLGQWIRNRGVRESVVILDKGAHTPHCNPAALTRQLLESLERLGTDYVDIYMLHRDNPEIPVGEFIEVLNEHRCAGRVRVFGASNWSLSRVEEANAYARARGLSGFAAVSNNFSLARMIEPPWAGCVSASDPASRAWFTETQTPLLPWSSQARGFFTGRARPDDRSDPELVRCWYSDDNFARLARAEELAKKYGVLPVTVALAYVLRQPFPTFPLIGPRALAETRTSFPALDVELPPEEVRWLNLEE